MVYPVLTPDDVRDLSQTAAEREREFRKEEALAIADFFKQIGERDSATKVLKEMRSRNADEQLR